ncbi:enoyl-CoA hydratase/isomerase family protein [Desulfosporosinus meridiei]|uniref:Enoyl-CoA hydratase/carnithine racemase n=1 Tax=Desulfosporosinus meridiei (strain ATCC BAA-275 / DSM 13257 / KCTC 12902 / NCIMB 13706 / S10) TaxID=768704 RepID=J7IY60_DESMD|nr:enoyl-CoA hydratase/isomerase family protein [Desulfosporosinus meridiei]AFQ44038.1 enoyl-CoA hydratase/carnithine racemase [Desulfosporosinus meridiei DSM 13257]
MSYGKHLAFNKDGRIGVITLDNARGFNLVGSDFLKELEEIQKEITADGDLGAIVINADGDNFSAGIDLKFLKEVSSEFIMANLVWLQNLYSFWQDLPIPVIAAINGLCYGSATELILGCDIRIAADDAKFSIPEVRFGLAPDMGGTTRLTHLVGIGQAKRLILGCEEIDAEEALRIGLVEILVKKEDLNQRAMKLAKKMAAFPPSGVGFAKKGINIANESGVQAGLLFEQSQSTFCCGTEDLREAVSAFLEKRKPVFKGR